ncbi:protein moonraker-like [Haliotis cracherodii]|uniref:protein moonraker-like n=1 Tax=Haliotis cracherodii TaxID=6455 RepID=UPI0039EBB1D5
MAYTDFPHQNQLQFNLNVPLKAKNLMVQHHHLQPVVIERVHDRRGTFTGRPNVLPSSQSSFQFQSVSEDRMAMAIQMARRDLKNKKSQQKSGVRSRSPSPRSSKTRVIHSKEYLERQKKWVGKSKKPFSVRERDVNRHPRTMKTQTPSQSPKPFLNTRAVSRLPVTTNSPPTRDIDVYPRYKVREDLEPSDNIERLQLELEGYLQQIKRVGEKALHDPDHFVHRSRSRKKDGYLSEEEDEERRVTRTEEFATRAARNLYNLRQQVRQIQRDLINLGPDSKVKQTKKSQAMSKLAAAHRGAARAIQAFVTNLPQQDLRSGLPSSFHELSLLIRQLTQLSSQIKQGQDSLVQTELTSMLDKVDDLNDAWEREVRQRRNANRESPPRKRSPVSRQLFDREEERVKQFRAQMRGHGKENKPKGVLKKTFKHSYQAPAPKVQPRKEKSPDRQATLRAGIAALMRDRDPSLEGRPRGGVSWNISLDNKPPQKKGLLLPAKLQAKREKLHKHHPQVVTDSHFADPTIAANRKAFFPLHNPFDDDSRPNSAPSSPGQRYRSQSHSPGRLGSRHPWKPPGTPTKSPATPKHRSRSFSPPGSRMRFFVEDVDKDIVKQLFPDDEKQTFKHSRKSRSVSSSGRNRSPRASSMSRRREPLRNSFVSSVVDEAKKRMKPYLKKGAASYPGYRQSRRSSPSPDRSSIYDDSVSSQLLEDILAETVHDLHNMDERERVRKKAVSMQDAPTLETIFQRLEEMEQEQVDIRRRWATVSYTNPQPVSKYFTTKEVLSDRPCSPPAIEVHRTGGPSTPPRHVKFSQQPPEEPIVFTKESQRSKWTESFSHKVPEDAGEREPVTMPSLCRPRTLLSIPQSVASRIDNHQEAYSSYLKKMSHHPQGIFQPWKLVQQISDEIFAECLHEVTGELDDFNEAIANHLYKSEFMEAKGQTPSPEVRPSMSKVTSRTTSPEARVSLTQVKERLVGRDISHNATSKHVSVSSRPVEDVDEEEEEDDEDEDDDDEDEDLGSEDWQTDDEDDAS